MCCVQTGRDVAPGRPWPESIEPLPPACERQAAASYLEAAAGTEDAAKKRFLRRRAAELLSPSPASWAAREEEWARAATLTFGVRLE
jgi:hypothetical protein